MFFQIPILRVIEQMGNSDDTTIAITDENAGAISALLEWDERSVFLTGPVGTGKTTVAAAKLADLIRNGVDGWFQSIPELHRIFKMDHNRGWQAVQGATMAEVLLIDDLGRPERPAPWMIEALEGLICRRYDEQLPVLITSNFSLDRLGKVYGEYVVSRLKEMCGSHIYKLGGPDWRRHQHANKSAGDADDR